MNTKIINNKYIILWRTGEGDGVVGSAFDVVDGKMGRPFGVELHRGRHQTIVPVPNSQLPFVICP